MPIDVEHDPLGHEQHYVHPLAHAAAYHHVQSAPKGHEGFVEPSHLGPNHLAVGHRSIATGQPLPGSVLHVPSSPTRTATHTEPVHTYAAFGNHPTTHFMFPPNPGHGREAPGAHLAGNFALATDGRERRQQRFFPPPRRNPEQSGEQAAQEIIALMGK